MAIDDLVLMDVEMPVMNGVTAMRQICALYGPVRDVPIVAMTAHVLPDQVERLLTAGADDYIGKPFNRAQLRDVIVRCLDDRPKRAPAAA
ncbi:Sensor histidine kinase RcsC [Methylobacterium tardum]|uniref:Response regulatory domain-containing protein n=1 Tax=Methylobacterium tardum TaxID=374432 RepID=A0AA37WT40_9HYPH|nr:response regulator [Methylobacterium tardum]URD38146.1 response regulator [Methylobacterium tardum]GJE50927.1 Sensor histidine kinase RcsC [Methylobacterium tardum]GLS69928.1 hypothetical protein GCM10007890_19410 [Methylobacterium tardum]